MKKCRHHRISFECRICKEERRQEFMAKCRSSFGKTEPFEGVPMESKFSVGLDRIKELAQGAADTVAEKIKGAAEAARIDSVSDDRIKNNIVNHEYRILTEAEKINVKAVKDQGLALITLIDAIGSSRELSLAKTKIEEAVMWAVKGITK